MTNDVGGVLDAVRELAGGPIDTQATLGNYADRGGGHFLEALTIKRLGTPEDLAEFVAYLCSDRAAWITGQVFHVNGGMWTRPG